MENRVNSEELIKRIKTRHYNVGVIGLGNVGLPLVLEFCAKAFKVYGFDIDPEKVGMLERGESYIQHISADLVTPLIAGGCFVPTTDYARTAEADVLILCVP